MTSMDHERVLRFWFEEIPPKAHWQKDEKFDAELRHRFGECHRNVAAGECQAWRSTTEGALAEVIVLDQFSRNIFRDQAQAFAYDGMALVLAQEAIAKKQDIALDISRRAFLYMPYMHSESIAIHEQAVKLFSQSGLEKDLEFELRHRRIIERFGRYPHRNAILGRESSTEEQGFLDQPGSSF